jgi:hypothetical protein
MSKGSISKKEKIPTPEKEKEEERIGKKSLEAQQLQFAG